MMKNTPNILWLMTDQQSYNMLGCAGNKYVQTPNLDKLAEHAVRFEHAYCTNPVCLPSRFSLFTGLYPGDIGVRSNHCERESQGVPQIVQDNSLGKLLVKRGYKAVYGGKEHFPFMDAQKMGFEFLSPDHRNLLAESCADYLKKYDWEAPLFMVASFINPHDICYMAIADADETGQRWMESGIQITTLREAIKIPEGMDEEVFYSSICPPLPDNYEPSADEPEAIDLLQTQRMFKKLARQNYSDRRWRLHRWAYAELTRMVDAQIGRVLDALEESGHWDDTVVLFTSDHGDMDASHKMEHKEALYEEACHIPLMIKGVGQKDGAISNHLVCNGLDMIPTVMDYSGITEPDYIRGKSLREIVEKENAEEIRDILVLECENGIGAVSLRYKYVNYDLGDRKEQFYDLSVNPGESYNQIDEVCYAEEVERFRRAIAEHCQNRPYLGKI